jgi:hypothetical protein
MDHSRAGRSSEGRLPHSRQDVVVVMLLDATEASSPKDYSHATAL